MKLYKMIFAAVGLALALLVGVTSANAASAYPINKPRNADWSFAGPFGHWDIGQLQRGFKIYRENCSACHSMNLVAFRNLEALGFSEEQIKAIAAEYEVTDGPDADGEMFDRTAVAADHFPSPFPNTAAAASANNGAYPPDFSLLAKARAPERGFPWFVFDIFTMYAENGPDYIYSLLTGYKDAPSGTDVSDGTYYNPYFAGGKALAMAPPLSEEGIEYTDGTLMTVDQYAKDVSAFMMWAAEPMLVERKQLGFKVMLFLLLFAALLYLSKKKVWSALSADGAASGGTGNAAAGSASRTAEPVHAFAAAPSAAPARARAAPVKATPKPAPRTARVAVKPAKSKGPERLSKPVGKSDDLKMISGVGPKLEKTLNGLGFWHFSQIAGWKKSDVAIVDDELSFKGRIERDDWIKQAKALAKGGRDEYVRVFGKEPR